MAYLETQKDRDFNRITSLMGDYMESQKTIKTMKRDMEDLRKQIKNEKNTISIKWGIDDIRSLGYECTDEQGSKVLADVKRFHDANIGVNWEVIDWHCEENKLNKYPFNEGDDYWTIENGKIVWSCWDDQSEELYKEGCEYFKTEAQAEQSLIKHMKKCEDIIIKSTKNN